MKYLLVLLVVLAVVAWWATARRRDRGDVREGRRPGGGVQPMLACAHCGVHLPRSEAVFDGAERAFCSDAHRLQGPR